MLIDFYFHQREEYWNLIYPIKIHSIKENQIIFFSRNMLYQTIDERAGYKIKIIFFSIKDSSSHEL